MGKKKRASKMITQNKREYSCRKEMDEVKDALHEFQEQVERIADMLTTKQTKQDLIKLRNQLAKMSSMVFTINHQVKERSIFELAEMLEPTAVRINEVLELAQAHLDAAEVRCIH